MKFAIVQAFQDMLHPPKLESIVAEELQGAAQEVSNAKFVIERHQFLLHMALAKIEALEDWNHGKRRTSLQASHPALPKAHEALHSYPPPRVEPYSPSTGKDYT